MKSLLQSPEKMKDFKAESEERIKQLNPAFAFYTAKLAEILRE
jgi:hypothetical protein